MSFSKCIHISLINSNINNNSLFSFKNSNNNINNNKLFNSINALSNTNNSNITNNTNNIFTFNKNGTQSTSPFNLFKSDNTNSSNNNNINNILNTNSNNIFSNMNNKNYVDNSKFIDIGKQYNLQNDDSDIWNDPFNPKWYSDESSDKRDYNENEIEILNKKIQNYIENNNGRKNYLEYCDNNSQIINTIKNFNANLEEEDFF